MNILEKLNVDPKSIASNLLQIIIANKDQILTGQPKVDDSAKWIASSDDNTLAYNIFIEDAFSAMRERYLLHLTSATYNHKKPRSSSLSHRTLTKSHQRTLWIFSIKRPLLAKRSLTAF
jgi:hypothetical protein